MQIWQLVLTILCSTGILTCLVYIVFQLHKQKLELYAQQKVADYAQMHAKHQEQVQMPTQISKPKKKSKTNK